MSWSPFKIFTASNGQAYRVLENDAIETFRSAKHVYSADMLRGIAAMMVMLEHFIVGNPMRFAEWDWLQYVGSFGHFGVQIFFVISGFVIPYSMHVSGYQNKNLGRFLLRRFIRLEPPYLISVALCLLLAIAGTYNPYSRGAAPEISWQQVAAHIGYLNAFLGYEWLNVVYWTLAIEFQFYIIVALTFTVISHRDEWPMYIYLMLSVALAVLFPSRSLIFVHLPLFLLGCLLFRIKTGKSSLLQSVTYLFVLSALIVIHADVMHLIFGLVGFCGILFVRGKVRPLLFLGAISYSLYLLHVPIGQRVLNLLENFTDTTALMFVAVVLCSILLVAVSWLYRIWIESPAQELARKINY